MMIRLRRRSYYSREGVQAPTPRSGTRALASEVPHGGDTPPCKEQRVSEGGARSEVKKPPAARRPRGRLMLEYTGSDAPEPLSWARLLQLYQEKSAL